VIAAKWGCQARSLLKGLRCAAPVRYRVLVLSATFAGLRWGELIALRRHNIDLEACEIRIVETTAQLDTGRLLPETPKSRAAPHGRLPGRSGTYRARARLRRPPA